MKIYNKEVGKIAEEYAANYLEKKGYEIIERNWQIKFGEIDIICRDNNILVFVEVKAKKTLVFGTPEEMFTRGKYTKVKRMATVYLKGREVPCRIDMVAVELAPDNRVLRLRHYENVVF